MEIAQYSFSGILAIMLGVIWKYIDANDRWKPLIAIVCGIGLGLVSLGYMGKAWTFVNIVNYAIYGFMNGAAAVGLYEGSRSIRNPRV